MYRPGEEVSLKGWLRAIDPNKNGDIGWTAGQVSSVSYRVTARGKQIASGSAAVSAAGGFDTRFTLPKTPGLGRAEIAFVASGALRGNHAHWIEIEEFRRPEFEVSAQASQGPFLVGGAGDVTVNAKYFAGGPLPGAPVTWSVTASQTSFTPPNHDDYVFGLWEPWWTTARWNGERGGGANRWSLVAKTDATGAHVLHLDFRSVKPALPMSVVASGLVTDVNRQAWSASSTLLVHPSSLYVGLKAKKPCVGRGAPFELDVIGVDVDGKPAVGAAIEVKAVRLDWQVKKGKYRIEEVEPQTCQVVAARAAAGCLFQTA